MSFEVIKVHADKNKPWQKQLSLWRSALRTKMKAIFAKRYALPAVYLSAVLAILGLVYLATATPGHVHNVPTANPANVTVSTTTTPFTWPVDGKAGKIQVLRGYYDRLTPGATVDSLSKALIEVGTSYQGSTGYDLAVATKSKQFAVLAAATGVVQSVRNSPTWGLTVTVQSPNGYEEIYRSLSHVAVTTGESVTQGQTIAKSGTNAIEKTFGPHLFFAITRHGVVVDPGTMLPKRV